MANETKDKAIRKLGAGALGALGRKKNKNTNREIGAEENRTKKITKKEKKTLGEKQYDTYVSELDSNFDKMGRVQKMYKGASPKIKADLKNKFKKLSDSFGSSEMISSANRETGRTEKNKGGRVEYKHGGGVGCAKRGFGKALKKGKK